MSRQSLGKKAKKMLSEKRARRVICSIASWEVKR